MTVMDQIQSQIADVKALLMGGSCALNPIPQRVIDLYPGDMVAWDGPCMGQLSFRLVSLRPVWQNASGRVTMKNPCSISWWEVTIELKIVRCVAVVNNAGTAPSPDQITADGNQLLSDMQQMLSAIEQQNFVYDLQPWVPSGPHGGAAAGSFVFVTRVDPDPCS